MDTKISYDLPPATEDQQYVHVSALNGGFVTLPERMFVTNPDPEKTSTVPSMCFLIVHELPEKTERLVFDLGIKRDITQYAEGMQAHISKRQPIITLPDTAASLRHGGLDPARDIDTVILSHSHWDHIGTPADYPSSRFVVGSGTLSMFATGVNHYPASMFEKDPLPVNRTYELPPVPRAKDAHTAAKRQLQHEWSVLAHFPHTVDYFGDGSMYIIDSPGHLRGHLNLLLRTGPSKWVYLGGDCCHDPRILTGEKDIALYDDGNGGQRSVHSDLPTAIETIDRIKVLLKYHHKDVEWIVAHDLEWATANKHRFFPGKI